MQTLAGHRWQLIFVSLFTSFYDCVWCNARDKLTSFHPFLFYGPINYFCFTLFEFFLNVYESFVLYSFVFVILFCVHRLSVLSLGGNLLTDIPDTVGNLSQLQALTLCDNLIEVLPASIARLTNLTSLLIHKNRLRHLPRDIIALKNLVEVSVSHRQ